MTISIKGITGVVTTESVNNARVPVASFKRYHGAIRDPQNGSLVAVYNTVASAAGETPVFCSVRSRNVKGGGIVTTIRLSAKVEDDTVEDGLEDIAASLTIELGKTSPSTADLRSFLAALYAFTYASVSSGTPESGTLDRIKTGHVELY